MYNEDMSPKQMKTLAKWISAFIGIVIAGIVIIMFLFPMYRVWQRGMEGEAELRQAEWNRQIMVREAQAKLDSAKMLASAEVERARGVAEANAIIGKSLKGNNEYLHYLWIHNLEEGSNKGSIQVIYVPTEANMPIMEAGRFSR